MITDYIDPGTATAIQTMLASPYKNKLVAAYINLVTECDGMESLQDVVDKINTECALNTKPQRLMDWRNGSRPCPKRVAAMMRLSLLQYLFADEAANALVELLDL